jgi:hypothetical protein
MPGTYRAAAPLETASRERGGVKAQRRATTTPEMDGLRSHDVPRGLLPPATPAERVAIARAKARLDRLALYPRPVDVRRVRIVHSPRLFALPWFRRFDGYEAGPLIFLRRGLAETSEDLLVHELCHVWQAQHRPVRMALSYLWQGYKHNRHEVEARHAVAATRDPA